MTDLAVAIEPLDSLIFGESRSAREGEAHARRGQDLLPPTLYGAVGARIARQLGARPGRDWASAEAVLGSFSETLTSEGQTRAELRGFCQTAPDGSLWFPRPLTWRFAHFGAKWVSLPSLAPQEPEAGALSSVPYLKWLHPAGGWGEGGQKAVATDKEFDQPLLFSERLLGSMLAGKAPPAVVGAQGVATLENFYRSDSRLGIGIDEGSWTAGDGLLFSRPYSRYRSRILGNGVGTAGYRAWYRVCSFGQHKPDSWGGTGFLGGDRRRVGIQFQPLEKEPLVSLQQDVLGAVDGSQGFLTYLLTPAVSRSGPVTFAGQPAVAAAVGKPVFSSGWNATGSHRGPRPILSLMPAGSVFFFEWADSSPEARRQFIRDHWLEPLCPKYRAVGFGRTLLGVW